MEQVRLLGERYELGDVLGRGGMAEVHIGRDARLGRTVALKTLRSDLALDSTFQARFRREAQSAASLNHPSIVSVYDTGEDMINGVLLPYIVMEYVDGSTLRELLQSGRRLLPERALEITAGVLHALEYSHRAGIIHRDIKPGNVMLTRAGTVKVMDFGIARAIADASATMTATAAVIGTAQYLSPEQAKGEKVDARSDLYSTGCLLYELLTGRPPFTGDSPVSVAYQHVRENPVPPSRLDPEITPALDAIVLKALAKHADNRYQSADEMREDLERALDGRPVIAPPVLADAATQRLAGVAPVGATSVVAPVPAAEEREKRRGPGYVLLALAVIAVVIGGVFLARGLFDQARQVSVPTVTGLNIPAAEAKLKAAGLTLNPPQQEFSDTVDAGLIISQDPAEGVRIAQGEAVNVVVSKGEEQVSVPSVVGDTEGGARQKLENAGLVVGDITERSSDQPKGEVLDSNPPAGTRVDPGSEVKLVVSSGVQQTEVPGVVGRGEDEAKAILESAGFKVKVTKRTDETAAPGTVLEQFPAEGEQRPEGSEVVIVVAEGGQQPGATGSPSPSPTETDGDILPPGNGNGNGGGDD
jgi:beta-lactam-binding protein with PASTA domain/predicted Ser/Thr protein kinase